MNDMSSVIVPKSDQLNAEDFLAGPANYTIEAVDISPGTEQPVSIRLVGEKRVWRPCKSMSRVLVSAWGPDARVYQGRAVTLYRDPKVKWGGMEIGGIRISHLSHIEREMLLQLTATKGKRAPHIVKPLSVDTPTQEDRGLKWTKGFISKLSNAVDRVEVEQVIEAGKARMSELAEKRPELHAECDAAIGDARRRFEPNHGTLSDDNPAASEGRDTADMGEAFNDDGLFEGGTN